MRVALSNSGGKDCYLSFLRAQDSGLNTVVSLTMLHESFNIARSHGTPLKLLEEQASVRGLPLLYYRASWQDYEQEFLKMLEMAKKLHAIEGVVFGDRCFEENREWCLKVCECVGLKAFHPIWGEDPELLWQEAKIKGIDALICSCLPEHKAILGSYLNQSIIRYLREAKADIFGENGEYHTFVTNGLKGNYSRGVPVEVGNYWFFVHDESRLY